ncbi:kinase-like domain-containing protein [Nemania sp. NC0429]|nr:kinase-like domain-containing protein [Nemania sp. NC0429]
MDNPQNTDRPTRPNRVCKPILGTPAGKWNAKVIDALRKAFRKDPELDLTTHINAHYLKRLRSFKAIRPRLADWPTDDTRSDDLRLRLDPAHPAEIIRELSPDLRNELSNYDSLSRAIVEWLLKGNMLYDEPTVTVVQVGQTAVKITADGKAVTEHGSLEFLKNNIPCFPAPGARGLVKIGLYSLLFMDFVPGMTLEEAWPQLDVAGKCAVRDQLDELLSQLRSLPVPDDAPLGGVQKEGCKDIRRFVYANSEPVMNMKQFEDFIFGGSKTASPIYTRFLRRFMPEGTNRVFTHGDFRPANIIVQMKESGGACTVQGIIDWEASGFYPAYWESIKATNNFTGREDWDWYEYLPDSASPHQHELAWLVDRLWDRSMDNS